MTIYADLADLPEDDRITAIGTAATAGDLVGFFVDDDEKADRYLRKLTERFPLVRVVSRGGPNDFLKGTVFVRVGPKGN